MSNAVNTGQEFKEDILREHVRLAIQQVPTFQINSFVVACILAYLVRDYVSYESLLAWLLMVLALTCSRIALYLAFRRVRNDPFDANYWRDIYLLLTLVSGTIWGISALMIYPSGHFAYISLFVLVLACFSAGTTISHSSIKWAPAAWGAPALLPYAIRCAVEGGELGFTLTLLILLYLLSIFSYSLKHHGAATSAIALRFENLKLIGELNSVNESLRLAHEELEERIEERTSQLTDAIEQLNREIEERKLVEETLRTISQQWQETFDAVSDMILLLGPDYRIVRSNRATLELLGKGTSEIVGLDCCAAVHGHSSTVSRCPGVSMQGTGRRVSAQFARGGRWFDISMDPILDESGSLINVVHIIRDITEKKRAEEEQRLSEESYRLLVKNIPGVVFRGYADGSVDFFDDKITVITGYSSGEFSSRELKWLDLLHPDDFPLARKAFLKALRGEREYVREYRLGCRNRKHAWIQERSQIVCREDGSIDYISGVLFDITERKHEEEEKEKLEAQLRQSHKMEAIGQLAGGIAHDFNNIITAILGYSNIILRRMEKESPLRRYVEQVLKAAERAAELTNGLLVFSRRQVLYVKAIDLCEVVQGLEKMLERLVPEDIDFRTTIADGELIVIADKIQIEQVLMNLVTNAKDAMPTGGTLTLDVSHVVMGERFVHAHGYGEPGDYVCITVSDTGHGMDEETRKRIFEPFFTTKEVGKGTGLGMAIIYGIIRQHNGYISVFSEKERGTTFRIYLPHIAEGLRDACKSWELEKPPEGTETVLLAEDDGAVRELHRTILEEAGYRVIEAVDGQEALDRFTEHRSEVDILATDVIMPKMNGKILYEEIRKIRPDMKVLFITGYTKDIIVERGIMDDEFSVIPKPVTSYELLKRMRETLDLHRS